MQRPWGLFVHYKPCLLGQGLTLMQNWRKDESVYIFIISQHWDGAGSWSEWVIKFKGVFTQGAVFVQRGAVATRPFTQGTVCMRQWHSCQRSKGRFYAGRCFCAAWHGAALPCGTVAMWPFTQGAVYVSGSGTVANGLKGAFTRGTVSPAGGLVPN